MDDIALRVENLSKLYRIGPRERYRTLRDTLTDITSAPFRRIFSAFQRPHEPNTIWALKDVSFEVKQGKVVGIIGGNGAGKSTLLKILSRITRPTQGRAEICGRVGSLLEIGTGFHPELTGRENIYLNGAILGMKKAEIERKFDEIVTFAEVERFLDTPVKHYSTGMYLRLAFAVAAHLEPEILLVDEILAVGDASFQKKCLGKMGEVARAGRTVLFVSHNMGAISSICEEGIVLEEGWLKFAGPAHEAISWYLDQLSEAKSYEERISRRKDRLGSGEVRLTDFYIENEAGERIDKIRNGESIRLVFRYEGQADQPVRNVDFQVVVRTETGELLFQFGTKFTGQRFKEIPPKGKIMGEIRRFPLVPGRYRVDAFLVVGGNPSDYIYWLAPIIVVDGDYYQSGYLVLENESRFFVDGSWSCQGP